MCIRDSYTYTFTSNPDTLRRNKKKKTPSKPEDWWSRKLKAEYFPTFSLETGELEGFMKQGGYLANVRERKKKNSFREKRIFQFEFDYALFSRARLLSLPTSLWPPSWSSSVI